MKRRAPTSTAIAVVLCGLILSALYTTFSTFLPTCWIALPKVLTEFTHGLFYTVFLFGIGCLIVTFVVYLALSIVSWQSIRASSKISLSANLPEGLPGISILIPARNEAATILNSIHSALRQDYPTFEVLVINDGSEDGTLEALTKEFNLAPDRNGAYRSQRDPRLFLLNRSQSGKSAALNAGLQLARSPFICTMDADTVLAARALMEIARPALADPSIAAVSGTLRLSNRPPSLLVQFQEIEYLRAFVHRCGWASLDSLMLVSGSFGLFRASTLRELGGFPDGTLTEDLDLVFRIHTLFRESGRSYKVACAPAAIAWTQAPEDLRSLAAQRRRWITGLAECLHNHAEIVLNPRYGFAGLLGAPFLFLELVLPVLVVLNFSLLVLYSIILPSTLLEWKLIVGFLAAAFAADTFNDWVVILIYQLSGRPGRLRYGWLYLLPVLEIFGYRQFLHVVQTKALFLWLLGTARGWGKIKRVKLAVEGGST